MKLLGTELGCMDFSFLKTQLVDAKIAEDYRLEYKGQQFLNKRKKPPEILKDKWNLAKKICGLANTQGGFIILGVEEVKQGKERLPGAITGTEIDSIGQLVPAVVHKALQPSPICNLSPPVKNDIDPSHPIFILEVLESPVPVMLWWEDCPHHGSFLMRRNDNTEVANVVEVEMLFRRTFNARQLHRNAQQIFNTMKEIVSRITQGKIPEIEALFYRISLGFQQDAIVLDVIPLEGKAGLPYFYLLGGKYQVNTDNLFTRIGDHQRSWKENKNITESLLEDLKKYWVDTFNIHVS